MASVAMEEDVQDQAQFDLESCIVNYTGHAKIDRLVFIAEKSLGKPLELEALKLAHDEVKKTDNTAKYTEVVQKIDGRLGAAYNLDKGFVDQVDKRAAQKQERLETELHAYKSNLIKESIRMGHNDLGEFFYERGDLQNAFKSYVRSRDYCTTSRHIITMCLNVIKVAIEMRNTMHINNYVAKAEQTPDVAADPVVMAKLRAAAGLAFLQSRKYKQAARKFVEVNAELGSSYSDVLAPQDIATYGALCALATFDRAELQSKVILNLTFKEFLELVPELRELIRDFHASRYASCLRALDSLLPSLHLDPHLAEHVPALYRLIRAKALTQYTSPFTSVDLNTMAVAFNSTVAELEKELASLIMDNAVQARIDSHSKVLYARHADVRGQTFQRVMSVGEAYLRETKALLLRANLLQHDFVHKPRRQPGGEGVGPGGRGGLAGEEMRRGPAGMFGGADRHLRELVREVM
mmetsp:Transcript_5331/g.11649  ORF Transcript_5331/g.11649 Transcript_5331/m.11649 type:complete len:465 (+) Transcript_5331:170-1564(+)|eukprot:CAMPEP_0202901674 /NCGR_PEP_ID=MMETSP1392-20130828/14392_1 /ASSEMBLY_ACC=CAM_ASM_000868 /TAXON_ID=225041 /ORGANISM="Chlamydomonas chlamydogama, Strain SAG 11-48b" /LENGTH=464 /DNA_ID=CAMNT_0049588277 /DNA_START=153 /DNA_END=1547 /DNA_ORIENTATION=-